MTAAVDPAQVPAGLDIEARSFAIIDAEACERERFGPADWPVARRMIHAAGDVGLERDLEFSPTGVAAAVTALQVGAEIWTDSRMAVAGISRSKLAAAHPNYAQAGPRSLYESGPERELARARAQTRGRCAVENLGERLAGALVVIGNAPTALEAVLDLCRRGGCPRAILGFPVGFVGAAESKERLRREAPCPWLTVRGRKGGSNLAAAAVNALAALAAEGNSGNLP